MTLRRALTVLLLTALAALSGCGDNGGRRDLDASVDPGLGPVTYVVTSVTEHGKAHPLVDGTEIRIRFADARVTLTAGCNTMSGGYQLEESRLTLDKLATTDMGCDQARMDQDTWLAGLFDQPVQLITGDQPTIVAGSTVLAMADRENVHPDRPLLGTTWQLDTIIDGDVASSVPSDRTASLRIVGRELRAKDGCNDGTGTVVVRNGLIAFADVDFTRRPCPSSAQVVPELEPFLSGSGSYVITENRLTITRDGHGLGFTAAE
ncbi:META domain-containing protein [Nocardioides marmorisolisilvae]|uniref:META domain-containing protein n=1 Tax=Nocardioides marmorisolisilvae TaxID=1542737 RepID=A0A3N0DW29_9ACTN|nr:META domain-containing protein [Nocardioides marmorisolisilvae]RNL79827.1 META domain-containing protein [Nocardioides marmorisolisilvae]